LEVPRSSYWYCPKEKTLWEQGLLKRMIELSDKHPRYGYRRIAALLRQEGWHVGKRRIQSLRRSLGLRVPPTKRKIIRRGHSTGLPVKAEYKGHVWTWDFICDGTTRGGALQMLTILDEYIRECHVLRADRALKSGDVLEWTSWAIREHGAPAYLRSDNGSEFIAKAVQAWLGENQIKTI
jgi:transposase InsO family protein